MSGLFGNSSGSGGAATQSLLFGGVGSAGANNASNSHGTGSTSAPQHNANGPIWFEHTKKRTITNHLVPKRKSAFQSTSASSTNGDSKNDKSNRGKSKNSVKSLLDTDASNEYNLVSFGSKQRKSITTGSGISDFDISSGDLLKYHDTVNETINEEFPLYNNNEDLPPSRSIFDLNDEVLISLNRPSSQHPDSFINKDPKNYNNVFTNKGSTDLVAIENNDTKQAGTTSATANGKASSSSSNPLNHGETAILVFGYPESMANQVILHFLELGNVLEDFEINKSASKGAGNSLINQTLDNNKLIVPIFSGESWVKITYDNPSSAIDALQENGTVFNGHLLGVIPYTRNAIEKLQKRKLTENEDIGGDFELRRLLDKSKKLDTIGNPGESSDIQGAYVKRLDIKDGSGLFLKANDPTKPEVDKKNDEKLGIWGKTLKFFFGFNEL